MKTPSGHKSDAHIGSETGFRSELASLVALGTLTPPLQRVVGAATPALQKAAADQGGKASLPSEEAVLTALVAALDKLTA